jgi:hypothetical protein
VAVHDDDDHVTSSDIDLSTEYDAPC